MLHSAFPVTALCYFNGCCNPVMCPGTLKCLKHRKKGICSVIPCRNQVNKRGLCLAHGARSDPCRVDACATAARVHGLCFRHLKIERILAANIPPMKSGISKTIFPTKDTTERLPTVDEDPFRDFVSVLSDQYMAEVPVALPPSSAILVETMALMSLDA
ncbi:Aste57867_10989 [Aphanomyces stellatus]|uniref:Aste57867_10989 protein n=1 Tax=Aphanomyces stellatus TaxID=120398 RepID=A0A485KRW5_9STRA|nr:hypothetical protein As57867_010948 [Aphanomyces stellatus]VFT87857.1 Aste57867_10989 [Aphanomyces stellatus]